MENYKILIIGSYKDQVLSQLRKDHKVLQDFELLVNIAYTEVPYKQRLLLTQKRIFEEEEAEPKVITGVSLHEIILKSIKNSVNVIYNQAVLDKRYKVFCVGNVSESLFSFLGRHNCIPITLCGVDLAVDSINNYINETNKAPRYLKLWGNL